MQARAVWRRDGQQYSATSAHWDGFILLSSAALVLDESKKVQSLNLESAISKFNVAVLRRPRF